MSEDEALVTHGLYSLAFVTLSSFETYFFVLFERGVFAFVLPFILRGAAASVSRKL